LFGFFFFFLFFTFFVQTPFINFLNFELTPMASINNDFLVGFL
jgi:hypothetical protein